MVSLIHFSIPKDAHCPLKWIDNLVTQETHPSEVCGHDLAELVIGHTSFPISSYVEDCNGKGKVRGEVSTSPMECAISDLSK